VYYDTRSPLTRLSASYSSSNASSGSAAQIDEAKNDSKTPTPAKIVCLGMSKKTKEITAAEAKEIRDRAIEKAEWISEVAIATARKSLKNAFTLGAKDSVGKAYDAITSARGIRDEAIDNAHKVYNTTTQTAQETFDAAIECIEATKAVAIALAFGILSCATRAHGVAIHAANCNFGSTGSVDKKTLDDAIRAARATFNTTEAAVEKIYETGIASALATFDATLVTVDATSM